MDMAFAEFDTRLSRTGNGSAKRLVVTSGIVTLRALTKPDRFKLAVLKSGFRCEGSGQRDWSKESRFGRFGWLGEGFDLMPNPSPC